MPYLDGWTAIRLEMPACIPRIEYLAENHWDLIQAVTGAVFQSSAGGRQKDPALIFPRRRGCPAWEA